MRYHLRKCWTKVRDFYIYTLETMSGMELNLQEHVRKPSAAKPEREPVISPTIQVAAALMKPEITEKAVDVVVEGDKRNSRRRLPARYPHL